MRPAAESYTLRGSPALCKPPTPKPSTPGTPSLTPAHELTDLEEGSSNTLTLTLTAVATIMLETIITTTAITLTS